MQSRSRRIAAWLAATLVVLATAGAARATGPLPVGGTLDLARADLQVTGQSSADATASAVAFVGDVNHDGRPDVALGAPTASPNGRSRAGTVWVLLSRQGPEVGLADASAPVMRIDGPTAGGRLGTSVAGLGDVNGDGIDDLLIGAPNVYPVGRLRSGTAFVVYGSADPAPVDLAQLGSRGYRIRAPAAGDQLGRSVAMLPDVDGDGRAETVLGAPNADPAGRADAGSVFVVLSAHPPAAIVDLANAGWPGWRIDGPAPGSLAGTSVANAGDVNGDGLADLLVGAPKAPGVDGLGSGAAYAVWARPPNAGAIDLGALGDGGRALLGAGSESAGYSVAGVGDVNRDGLGDLAVGAYNAPANGRTRAGSAYVAYGTATPGTVALADTPTAGVRINGAWAGDQAGVSVSAAGDVDGDGSGDVLVGANGLDPLGRTTAGGAYVVFGVGAPGIVDLGLAGRRAVRLAGVNAGDATGTAVAGGATTDADGHPVLLIGGWRAGTPAIGKPGRAWLMTLPGPPPPVPPAAPKACPTGARNVEVVVDDSGSMRTNDPGQLRRQALELMLSKPGNVGRVLGALEFGTGSQEIFPPLVIGLGGFNEQRDTILGLLTEHVRANAGQTNYTAAFTDAQRVNPGAEAQIMLTDGYHNVGPDLSTSIVHVPTYTVGLGISASSAGGRRLLGIARATGAETFAGVTAADLQAVLNHIDSLFACETAFPTAPTGAQATGPGNAPSTIPAVISSSTPTATFKSVVPPTAPRLPATAEMVLSWSSAKVRLEVDSIRFLVGARTRLRISAAKLRQAAAGQRVSVGGVRIRGSTGATFLVLRFTGLDHVRAVGARAAARSPWRIVDHVKSHGSKPKHKQKQKRKRRARSVARAAASPPRVRVYTQWYGHIRAR